MNKAYYTQGWTLVELMIVVAIIGLLASIAIPSYNSYISTSESGVTTFNLRQLATFEENYFYEAGDYFYANYTPPAANPFDAAIGWSPDGDNNLFIYDVSVSAVCPATATACATITVKHVSNPIVIVASLDLVRK